MSEDDSNPINSIIPNPKEAPPSDLGIDYILDRSGEIPTAELSDPKECALDQKRRDDFIQRQELVKIVSRGSSTHEVIDCVLKEISEELSHLKWERQQLMKSGKSTTNQTITRIAGLKQLSEVLLKKQETLKSDKFDLKSPKFQEILRLWMEFLYESMQKANLGEQEIDLVFNTMKADMDMWEKKILDI